MERLLLADAVFQAWVWEGGAATSTAPTGSAGISGFGVRVPGGAPASRPRQTSQSVPGPFVRPASEIPHAARASPTPGRRSYVTALTSTSARFVEDPSRFLRRWPALLWTLVRHRLIGRESARASSWRRTSAQITQWSWASSCLRRTTFPVARIESIDRPPFADPCSRPQAFHLL
jgi:hypothetical protein